MRILVVIPVYNRPVMVVEALATVAAQRLKPALVTVVDDQSTDATAEAVSAWIAGHPEVPARLIRAPHGGAAAARNRGLAEAATGMEAVAFLDSDDLWPDDFLLRASQALAARPDAVAASADRENWTVDLDQRRRVDLAAFTRNPWLWMLKQGGGIGSGTLFRLAAVLNAGGFPEDLPTGHDSILFGRVAARGAWLHLPGRPAVFRRFQVRPAGDQASHLHLSHPDYPTQWARVAAQLLQEAPATPRLSLMGRGLVALRWHHAAAHALRRDDSTAARDCLGHALRLRPWRWQNWRLWWLIRTREKRCKLTSV